MASFASSELELLSSCTWELRACGNACAEFTEQRQLRRKPLPTFESIRMTRELCTLRHANCPPVWPPRPRLSPGTLQALSSGAYSKEETKGTGQGVAQAVQCEPEKSSDLPNSPPEADAEPCHLVACSLKPQSHHLADCRELACCLLALVERVLFKVYE